MGSLTSVVRMYFLYLPSGKIQNIMKTDRLNDILDIVSEVCEVKREDILSHCKREDVVDARCIFVHYCKKYGFQSIVLMEFLNRNKPCVIDNYLRNYLLFSKQSYMFRAYSKEVSDKLSAKLPPITL